MGSLSWRTKKSVEIHHVWQPRTYEETIARKVQQRVQMMRTLLGAGQWLSDEPSEQKEFQALDRYRLNFSPKGTRPSPRKAALSKGW
jgi:hypothetical protein